MQEPFSTSVRDLQDALRILSREYPEIEPLQSDGVFGPETTRAVTQFQYRFDLPPTGTADAETWDALFLLANAITNARRPPSAIQIFPDYTHFSVGDQGDAVWIIQIILQALGQRYKNYHFLPPNGVLSEQNRSDIRTFQQNARLPTTGVVDKNTWRRLSEWYQMIQNS